MNNSISVTIRGNELILDPDRVLWWEAHSMLVVADVHVGKAAHFRQNGIAIHKNVNVNNFWNLSKVLDRYKPEQLVILGDLSHSFKNKEWDDLVDFREMYPQMDWILVDGNHDLLDPVHYDKARINRVSELVLNDILMVHDRSEVSGQSSEYILSGHVHPAVRVKGKARQSLRLDCFYFAENEGVLPAFGEFTGRFLIKPLAGDKIFAIAGGEVIELA